jgi:nucleotide-binding universal stress UspA family protein
MIKDIVVNISPSLHDGAGVFALSAATMFDAHVTGVINRYLFEMPGTILGASAAAALVDAQRRDNEKVVIDAVAAFERAAKLAGVSHDCTTPEVSLARAPDQFGKLARTYDLSIVRQPDHDHAGPEELIIEGALFGSGRPVLIVPYVQKAGMKLDHVTVCWDGGRAATRAIADATPFLRKSKSIDILMVQPKEGPPREVAGADMARHMARHGLNVALERLTVPDLKIADAILSYAADRSSDLLVMGGYGHSRLREFILGGVTREILSSMTLPTLMSH